MNPREREAVRNVAIAIICNAIVLWVNTQDEAPPGDYSFQIVGTLTREDIDVNAIILTERE